MKVLCAVVLLLAVVLLPAPARAEPPPGEESAAMLYARGQVAYDDQDFVTAAKCFARADALEPRAEVLELALACAVRGDDAVLGMTLGERAAERGLPAIAASAREIFRAKVGRLVIHCPPRVHCAALVDGAPAPVGDPIWARVGERALVLDVDGETRRSTVLVVSTTTTSVDPVRDREDAGLRLGPPAFAAPPPLFADPATIAKREPRRPIHPGIFFAATGVTLAALGATIVSGVDTLDTHAAFASHRSASAANDGESAQARTNVLLAATVGLALVTTTMGLFFTNW